MADKVQVSILGIQQDLKNGLDRKQIAEKYGLTSAAITRLFKHEKLKGLKVIKPKEEAFELVDDAPERPRKPARVNSPKVVERPAKATPVQENESDTSDASVTATVSQASVENPIPAPAEVKEEPKIPPPIETSKGVW